MIFATLALAALLDESVNFDGVIRFDALDTTPGTPSSTPGTLPPSTATSSATVNGCLSPCTTSTVSTCSSQIASSAGVASSSVTGGSCGATCARSTRSLLQTTGQTVTFTITGATTGQLQALQNAISAGNLVPFGIPATAVVTAVVDGSTVTFTPQPVALTPANPAPGNPVALKLCNTTSSSSYIISKLPCVNIFLCTNYSTTLNAAGYTTICCGCANTRRALKQATTFAPTSNAPLATMCAVLTPVYGTVNGCGKQSKKGLLGLLGLLGLIPLFLVLLLCCLCLLRRKRRGQAMMFSQTHQPAPVPLPPPAHLHAAPVPAPAF